MTLDLSFPLSYKGQRSGSVVTLTDRVRARILALIDAKQLRYKELASALGLSQSMVSNMLGGTHGPTRGIHLDYLPGIAKAMRLDTAELVVDPGSRLVAVNDEELSILLAYRDLDDELREAIGTLLLNLPSRTQRGRLHDHLRRAPDSLKYRRQLRGEG